MSIFQNGLCHILLFVLITCINASDNSLSLDDDDDGSYFTNEFAVLITGGIDVARDIAMEHGYQLKSKVTRISYI